MALKILRTISLVSFLLINWAIGCVQNASAIEVFANGVRYGSIEQYIEFKEAALKNSLKLAKKQNGFQHLDDFVVLTRDLLVQKYRCSPLTGRRYYLDSGDIEHYFFRQQTEDGNERFSRSYQEYLLEFYSKVSHLGFNTGVARVVEDFREHAGNQTYYKWLLAKDLESTLSQSFGDTNYKGPILIISHKKKLRIMTLGEVVGGKAEANNP